MEWYLKVIKENYANFSGRARRKEYWMFALVNFLIMMVLYIPMIIGAVSESSALATIGSVLIGLYALATLVPTYALIARRLHDTGRSAWWYLIAFTGVGVIVLLVWFCTDSEVGENQWGPDPKAGEPGH